MTTLLLTMLMVSLAVIAALYWRQYQEDSESEHAKEDARISPLLRGINYLLSDEPDRALQEMVQVARLRSEAAEVYMALGEMFRSQGEIGRAVRIHQNILARPDVPQALHLQAYLALGKDFQTGGLLDRSLKHYKKALAIQSDHLGALTASLRIREHSKEWAEAVELLSRIERIEGEEDHLHRAYLIAEMAEESLREAEPKQALLHATHALELNAACAHAYMVLIEIHLQQRDDLAAEKCLQAFQQYAVAYVPVLLPILLANSSFYQAKAYAILLQSWLENSDEELALAWIEAVAAAEGLIEAEKLKKELKFKPLSLRSSLRLTAIDDQSKIPMIKQTVLWREKMKRFSCVQCGVKVVEMRWQCPQCHTWSSMESIKGDEDA